ncbi:MULTISPECIES: DUF1540 domain-containing protein [Aneurinibacillus]|nr:MULTISPECIES: DUF1540 domain-containing protein [Aneurinibacillus]AMA73799.1 hypothetical protein ACH33_13660 [Aneurinibacillus sp. XH2]MED0676630.1 DUF1540 domain-containing protein [Aneurinibacillus thermoaerophilus]MED0679383.1 DUF1540 domain-containing protein [Aneurinibacillus thermoaerophilus]MED0738046.1 DUF1540 domain-containing protein [Aneurinibacillus thermoaerophilus]MED0756467.1 DUF1540 domain-containing protein [Aneurinibacillus thermoaerophilus]
MPQGVKCSVSNCTYWGQGNNCVAEAIMVDIDRHADTNYKEEIGEIGISSDRQEVAQYSSETCCHTFKPKQKA